MVAPSVEQSARSMALTIGGFTFKKMDELTYAIDGTPVDCVNFAHVALDLKPDLVVSGTNNGYNVGIDILYSGTVGACKQAQYHGYKSIAFSADKKGNTILEQELEKTLQYILDNNLHSTEYTLNVNFPREKFGTSKGLKHVEVYHQIFEYKPEIVGNKLKPHRQYVFGQDLPENSDAYAYKEGYTSISKVTI
jgi:5'-nucleotidase